MMLAELERLSNLLGESWSPTDKFKTSYLRGADELQLVRSGLDDTMREALQAGGRTPEDVDHVNAHGTGTRLNDTAEANAIQCVLGKDVPTVSTKAYTGHTLGAAAAIELAFSACAIEEGWIPQALGEGPVDPKIELKIPTEKTAGTYRRVLSNSFAFGGNNVSLLVAAP